MNRLNFRMTFVLFALGALVLLATVSTEVRAQAPAVAPAATQILKRMTDYLGSLNSSACVRRTPSRTCSNRGTGSISTSSVGLLIQARGSRTWSISPTRS
jgi:hypothetical protein